MRPRSTGADRRRGSRPRVRRSSGRSAVCSPSIASPLTNAFEADPAAQRNNSDPQQERYQAGDLSLPGCRSGFAPATQAASHDQMEGQHVDARQDEQQQLGSELKILRVADSVRREQGATRQDSEYEGRPGERQYVRRYGDNTAVRGSDTQQPEVDN